MTLSPAAKTILERYRQGESLSDEARASALEKLKLHIATGRAPSIPLEDIEPPPPLPSDGLGRLLATPVAKGVLVLAVVPVAWLLAQAGQLTTIESHGSEAPTMPAPTRAGTEMPLIPRIQGGLAEPNGPPEPSRAPPRRAATPSEATPLRDDGLDLIDEDIRLLRAAHAALRSGRNRDALETLATHARQFPSSKLTDSREAALIFALCAEGKRDQARRHVNEFRSRWPDSPLLPNVVKACGPEDPP